MFIRQVLPESILPNMQQAMNHYYRPRRGHSYIDIFLIIGTIFINYFFSPQGRVGVPGESSKF